MTMAQDAIATFDYHPMFVCFQKIIVKNDQPLSMVRFSLTMHHKHRIRSLADILRGKGSKGIRKLTFDRIKIHIKWTL